MQKQIAVLAALTLALGDPREAQLASAPSQSQKTLSSYQLISRALAAGQINEETAYKYRVFAAFGHAGLPQPYRGDDRAITEPPPSVLRAGALLRTFSAATQTELAPFFMTPASPGSWVELSAPPGDSPEPAPESVEAGLQPSAEADLPRTRSERAVRWHTVLAAGGKVKVWAQLHHSGDSAKAEAIASEITTTIWPELVPLLGPSKSDTNDPLNSGGPELDIFLVRPSAAMMSQLSGRPGEWNGVAMPAHPDKCKDAAFYLLVNSRIPLGSKTQRGLLQVVAHEVTHALTGAKPLKGNCEDYDWMVEATARWAEHKAYPKAQSEWNDAVEFFGDVSITLDTNSPGDYNAHAYNSYLFPLYLQLNNKEQAIAAIWNRFQTMDLRAAIDGGLKANGLKFEEVFPKFAVQNLNQASADDYRRLDQLPFSPAIADSQDVTIPSGKAEYEKGIDLRIEDLATHYTRFVFDQTVQMVTFENTLAPMSYAGVWLVAKINNSWENPVDLTGKHNKMWCRDHPLEDIQELIVVFTNNEWKDTSREVKPDPAYKPMLRAYPEACGRGWTGTSDMVNTITSLSPNLKIVETVHTTMRFEVDSTLIIAGQPREYWKTVGGHMTWQVTVTGECTGSARGGVPIVKLPDDHVATLRVWTEGGKRHHMGSNGPWPGDVPRYTITCPTAPPATMTFIAALGFFQTDGVKDDVAPDGKSFSGSHSSPPVRGEGIETRHSYSFRCSRNC